MLTGHMAKLAGYGTFLVEHLIFGLFLGRIIFRGAKRARWTPTPPAPEDEI